jgi:hypothetical protein
MPVRVDMAARGEAELQTDLHFDIVFAGSGKGQQRFRVTRVV